MVQYGEKSAEEAAAFLEERIRSPSGDDGFTLFRGLPWYCAMGICVFLVALGVDYAFVLSAGS